MRSALNNIIERVINLLSGLQEKPTCPYCEKGECFVRFCKLPKKKYMVTAELRNDYQERVLARRQGVCEAPSIDRVYAPFKDTMNSIQNHWFITNIIPLEE